MAGLPPSSVDDAVRWVVWSGDDPVNAFPAPSDDWRAHPVMASVDLARRQRPDATTTKQTQHRAQQMLASIRGRFSKEDQVDLPTPPPKSEHRNLFEVQSERIPSELTRLLDQDAAPFAKHPSVPATAGVYLFSEGANLMYVGQTRNLRQRLRQHTAKASRENQASFAFNLAIEAAAAAGLAFTGTRKERAADPEFASLFTAARERVAAMDVRFIELPDPIERTLFEVFAADALNLPYNDFETH